MKDVNLNRVHISHFLSRGTPFLHLLLDMKEMSGTSINAKDRLNVYNISRKLLEDTRLLHS